MTEPNRVHDVGAFGFRAWRYEARLGHRAHSHHDFEVNHVDRGWCEYVIGGQRVRLTEGRCYLFWATVPHQMVDAASGTELGWVVLPANWLWQWRVPSWAAAALLGGDVLGDAHPEPGDRRMIARWGQMLARHDPQWTRIAELEVEARFRRMMLQGLQSVTDANAPSRETDDQAASPLARVEAMAAFMTEHSHEPITVADIAAHVRLDPSYAMRQFRKHMKMTLIDYLTRQRIAAVKRRLMTSNDALLNIAYACGFGSASRFYEAFHRLTGTTPAQFRKTHRQA